jgi:hypothetical protein
VFVAALAAGLGDLQLTVDLLDRLPDTLDADLAAAVARLRDVLPQNGRPAGTAALR